MPQPEPRVGQSERLLPLPAGYVPLAIARKISVADLISAWRSGLEDFRAAPGYGLLFGAIYAVLGVGSIAICLGLDWDYLIFPVVSGFLLFGPFAALGLYEISRRRSLGRGWTPYEIFFAFKRHGGGQIALFGLFLVFMIILWLKAATLIYAVFFGLTPQPLDTLLYTAVTSWLGLRFIMTGFAAGALLAAVVFSTSVFAVPMLLDKDIDVVTAILTSLRAVRSNIGPMLLWGLIIAICIGVSLAAGFIGLMITMPVVGHATWHLYTHALQQDEKV